mmetsp:Transcript_23970/g.68648  ORF Transcript_23970/g.68648 Transcript_23970/m.68648 type:complete len:730 (-) Transcript_23970:67-2256(-)
MDPTDKFSGTWKDVDNTMVVIKDALLCGMEGHPIALVSEGNSCWFESGDQQWQGKLTDDDHIVWDDGEVWERLELAPGSGKQAMEEEKLKQKIAAYLKKRSADEDAARRNFQSERLDRIVRGGADSRTTAVPENNGNGAAAAPSLTSLEEDMRAKSQAGSDKARQAFEAERARKNAAVERARATRAQQSQQAEEASLDRSSFDTRPNRPEFMAMQGAPGMPGASGLPVQPFSREDREAIPTAGLSSTSTSQDRARQVFEQEKARKAAALERARSRGSGSAEGAESQEFEQAKARSEAGIDRARKAFEQEKARKAAALERARAKASARQDTEQAGPAVTRPAVRAGYPGVGKGSPPEPRQEEFSPGQYVKIIGLSSQPSLNGQIATLMKFQADKGRWQARIPGRSSILVRPDNMVQATAEEKARASHSPGPGARGKGKGKDGGKEPGLQCVVQIAPGEDGNDFDVKLSEERSMQLALEKIVGTLARRGVATCEANTPIDIISGAYDEALELWKRGEFGPTMSHMEGRPEAQVWQEVLHQSEQKAFWIREDLKGPQSMDNLKILSRNMWDMCHVLAEELLHQMGIGYTSFWSAMLSCYCGDKSYNLHLDNPNGSDESGVPDNGLRLTLCYYINPYWEPKGPPVSSCGGGLDVHLTEPWETPPSLLAARKASVMRIAPHADTLVIFLSQRMAHRVIATQGDSKWFALWVWCWDEQVKSKFDVEAAELVKDVY